MNKEPLVSVIIRTCGRPDILKRALESVRSQTYGNIEVILVEDGENVSEPFLKDFPELDIHYYAMGKRCGRTVVGNKGLELSNGKYLNFLDDDDIFLPSHISTLVSFLEENKMRAAYAVAEEHQIQWKKDAAFKVKRKLVRYRHPFNRMLLFYMNYLPIQTIMFERELYEQCGGFDEELDVLEDWDVWVRYAMVCDFGFVDKVTSVYYTPFRNSSKRSRDAELKEAEDRVREKHNSCLMQLSVAQINKDMDYVLNVFNQKNYIFYMKKIRNWLLYRDR